MEGEDHKITSGYDYYVTKLSKFTVRIENTSSIPLRGSYLHTGLPIAEG